MHNKLQKELDFIQLFTGEKKVLQSELPQIKKYISKNGMIWICWPKKSSKIPTDLSENIVRDIALKNGLVDIKVCAIDMSFSGLKLVYRLKDR